MTPISARSRRPTRAAHDVLGPGHRVRRVHGEHLADHQPVEQHADRGEMLLDGRLGGRFLQRLDIDPDVNRLDVGEPAISCCSTRAKHWHAAR